MKNEKIKIAMVENGIKQWELARIIGIHEGTLSRKMRDELPAEEQNRIIELMRQYKKNGGGEDNVNH